MLPSIPCAKARYFYDVYHIRNPLGELAIARICGDRSKMIPEDFGVLLTCENVSDYLDGLGDVSVYASTLSPWKVDDSGYTARVPILLYHHIAPLGDGGATISAELFEKQIKAFKMPAIPPCLFRLDRIRGRERALKACSYHL